MTDTYQLPNNTVLVLRTCNSDMTSFGGFVWPRNGHVECSDWSDVPECGKGLHGLLWGAGVSSLLDWSKNSMWLVAEVPADSVVKLIGKVKFPKANVVFCGDRVKATKFIQACAPAGTPVICGTATAGDEGTATAGYRGTATAGHEGFICILWWDQSSQRYRLSVGAVGEDGIKKNTKYKVDTIGQLVEVEEQCNG